LEGGPPRFRPRFTAVVLLRCSSSRLMCFRLRDGCPLWCAVPRASSNTQLGNCCLIGHDQDSSPTTPRWQRMSAFTSSVWADPRSLATTRGVSFDLRSSGYLDVSVLPVPFSSLCIQDEMTAHYRRRVFPFGNPRVKGCSAPHRGLSQPSTSFFGSRCQGIHRVPFLS
jgi:hypothetical protein